MQIGNCVLYMKTKYALSELLGSKIMLEIIDRYDVDKYQIDTW